MTKKQGGNKGEVFAAGLGESKVFYPRPVNLHATTPVRKKGKSTLPAADRGKRTGTPARQENFSAGEEKGSAFDISLGYKLAYHQSPKRESTENRLDKKKKNWEEGN